MTRGIKNIRTELQQWVPKNSKILVAVSGGVDSVTLLDALVKDRRLLKIEIAVAHVNHNLRKSSRADTLFVTEVCSNYKVVLHETELTPPSRGNIELWGREERYRFCAELCEEFGYQVVVTAHNANDVAETLLMRIVGNRELSSIERVDYARRLIRPLLSIPRSEIEAYANRRKLTWREDPTNKDRTFLRNKVRRGLLPYLAKNYDPRIVEVLNEIAMVTHEDKETLETLAEAAISNVKVELRTSKVAFHHLTKVLDTSPAGLRWRMISLLFEPIMRNRLPRAHAQRVLGFFASNAPQLELPHGFLLQRSMGGLRVTKKGE